LAWSPILSQLRLLGLAGLMLSGSALAQADAPLVEQAADPTDNPTAESVGDRAHANQAAPEPGAQAASEAAPAADLKARLATLQRSQAELETQAAEVPALERALDASQRLVERAEAEAAELREEIAQLRQQRQTETEKHTAQLNAAELRLREHKDRFGSIEGRIQQLERTLAQREQQIEQLEAAEVRRAASRAQLEARLAELRARLPAPEGGTVTAQEARAQAEEDADELEHLLEEGRGIRNPQLWQQIRAAENALHRSQFLLARVEGARTVYRVRPGDALARISLLFYGDDQRWDQIFEANRHLLTDPNQVMPGLSLVIP
jgi:nucleoid-associated protein YgaU